MKTLAHWQITKRLRLSFEWKLADLWVGGFYARKGDTLHVWVCLLPCLPLHFEVIGS